MHATLARRKRPSLGSAAPGGPSPLPFGENGDEAGAGPERPPAEAPARPGALGHLLLERGLIGPADLSFILSWQRSLRRDWPVHRLGSLLVKAGLLTVRQVAEVLGAQRGLPVVTELPRQVAPWLRQFLPQEMLREHGAVPLYVAGPALVVGMEDPDREGAVAALQAHTVYVVRPVLALQFQVHRLLRTV